MAKAQVPGDHKVYQMICNRLIIKATKFQQSSANCFWAVAKNSRGRGKFAPQYKLGLTGFSLDRLDMGGFVPPYGGDKCRGTKR